LTWSLTTGLGKKRRICSSGLLVSSTGEPTAQVLRLAPVLKPAQIVLISEGADREQDDRDHDSAVPD
jgi:hypothetical protein